MSDTDCDWKARCVMAWEAEENAKKRNFKLKARITELEAVRDVLKKELEEEKKNQEPDAAKGESG